MRKSSMTICVCAILLLFYAGGSAIAVGDSGAYWLAISGDLAPNPGPVVYGIATDGTAVSTLIWARLRPNVFVLGWATDIM